MKTADDLPDERGANSPTPDPERPSLLEGMAPNWRFVYDRLREGHAAAVLGQQEKPNDPDARALLIASTQAVKAFREAYEKSSTQAIARQIGG